MPVSKNEAEIIIDNYYQTVTTCIKQAVHTNISHSVKGGYYNKQAVAGCNDVVKDKHDAARAAFLDWVEDGKPRQGPLFSSMNSTRAAFKLCLSATIFTLKEPITVEQRFSKRVPLFLPLVCGNSLHPVA